MQKAKTTWSTLGSAPNPQRDFGKVFGASIVEELNDQVKDFVLYFLYRKETLNYFQQELI